MKKNQAEMESFANIITSQASAYSALKTGLGMSNQQLIQYIKSQAINNYNQQNMVISLPSRGWISLLKDYININFHYISLR